MGAMTIRFASVTLRIVNGVNNAAVERVIGLLTDYQLEKNADLLPDQVLHLREDQDHRGTQRDQNHRRKNEEEYRKN